MLTVRSGPAGDEPVDLDTTALPARRRVGRPAGAGGAAGARVRRHQGHRCASDAEDLADRGYAVLTWTARGLRPQRRRRSTWTARTTRSATPSGCSTGWPPARTCAPTRAGDPRVGVVGGSYGGGAGAAAGRPGPAGRRDRPDDHLERPGPRRSCRRPPASRRPTACSRRAGPASSSAAAAASAPPVPNAGAAGGAAEPASPAADPACGRFAADVCAAYLPIATTGRADPAAVALLRRSSPASVLDRIKAPTLLIQGEADTLFPLTEADANARGIAATGTPVRVAWFTGGHDGGAGPQSDQDRLQVPDRPVARPLRQGRGRRARRQLHLLADRRLRRARPGPGRHRLLAAPTTRA